MKDTLRTHRALWRPTAKEKGIKKTGFRTKVYDAVTALVSLPISIFSPGRSAMYRHYRQMYRTFIAGELTGPNQNFRPGSRSADAEIKRGLKTILGRCRDQAQNNPSIAGNIRRIANNVIRSGIRPQFQFRDSEDKLDTNINRAWEKLFMRWARYSDVAGHDSFWAQQRLALSHMWIDGEYFIHRVWDTSIPGVVPLRLELLERDHLNTSIDGELDNGNIARQGVEQDPVSGKPIAYHLFPNHPGDYQYGSLVQDSRRILAEDIIHVFERQRISQSLGVPWIVSIVMEAFDLEDYRSFERIGAKLAAAFGIFVKTNYPDLGGPGLGVQPGAENSEWPTSWKDMPDYIEPGRIQTLPYGTDIAIASHNRPGNQYEPYVKESRRTQSVGLGMSYEASANDYSDASYSSTRSGALEERLSYQGQQFFIDEKMNDKVAAWFIEAAWMAGLNPMPMPGFRFDPYPYLEAVQHQDPGWSWVDPYKDGQGSKLKIDNFLSTYRREAAAQGVDFDEMLVDAIDLEEKLTPLYEARAKNKKILEAISAKETVH